MIITRKLITNLDVRNTKSRQCTDPLIIAMLSAVSTLFPIVLIFLLPPLLRARYSWADGVLDETNSGQLVVRTSTGQLTMVSANGEVLPSQRNATIRNTVYASTYTLEGGSDNTNFRCTMGRCLVANTIYMPSTSVRPLGVGFSGFRIESQAKVINGTIYVMPYVTTG